MKHRTHRCTSWLQLICLCIDLLASSLSLSVVETFIFYNSSVIYTSTHTLVCVCDRVHRLQKLYMQPHAVQKALLTYTWRDKGTNPESSDTHMWIRQITCTNTDSRVYLSNHTRIFTFVHICTHMNDSRIHILGTVKWSYYRYKTNRRLWQSASTKITILHCKVMITADNNTLETGLRAKENRTFGG